MITIDETSLECTQETCEYNIHQTGKKPRVVLGYRINTIYDHNRHEIPADLNPVRLRILSKDFDDVNEWYFIYGVDVEPTTTVKHMFHNMIDVHEMNITKYYDYLEMFGLSCDENYLLSRKNIYIIDSKHLASITGGVYTNINDLKKTMTNPNVQYFQNCDAVKIFLIV